MKNTIKYNLSFFNYLVNTQKFKLVFIMAVITSVFGVISLGFEEQYTYFDGFLNVLGNPYYIMALYIIIFIHTTHTISMFDKNENYVIRCESKKKYIKEMISKVIFNNTLLYIILLLLVMVGLNFFCFGKFNIYIMGEYQIYNIIYLIYFLFRIYIIFMIMSIINIFLSKMLPNMLIIILNCLLAVGIVTIPMSGDVISSVIKVPLFIGNFLTPILFNSFAFDILCSAFVLALYLLIARLLFGFIRKHNIEVGR